MCATDAIGWMEGEHPTSPGEIVLRKICFRWSSQCQWPIHGVRVTACMGYDNQLFYLYQLKKPTVCSLAYCVV